MPPNTRSGIFIPSWLAGVLFSAMLAVGGFAATALLQMSKELAIATDRISVMQKQINDLTTRIGALERKSP